MDPRLVLMMRFKRLQCRSQISVSSLRLRVINLKKPRMENLQSLEFQLEC